VISHETSVVLSDVTFKVSEAGRQRVIREGRKNVHAGIEGYHLKCEVLDEIPLNAILVRYNPYLFNSFVDICDNPLYIASKIYLHTNGKAFILQV
jgi:hypothetical protein